MHLAQLVSLRQPTLLVHAEQGERFEQVRTSASLVALRTSSVGSGDHGKIHRITFFNRFEDRAFTIDEIETTDAKQCDSLTFDNIDC
jgi:hypothetical protein